MRSAPIHPARQSWFSGELCWTAIKYGLVGVANTAITAFVMVVGAFVDWHYVAYSTLGYVAGIVSSYFLNLRFTFRVRKRFASTFLRFVSVCGICFLVAQGCQIALIEIFGVGEAIAVALAMVLYTGVGFALNRALVFRPEDALQR